jgi:hypothetical protein
VGDGTPEASASNRQEASNSENQLSRREQSSIDTATIGAAIISIINSFQQGPPATKAKRYPNAFIINEELLKNLFIALATYQTQND